MVSKSAVAACMLVALFADQCLASSSQERGKGQMKPEANRRIGPVSKDEKAKYSQPAPKKPPTPSPSSGGKAPVQTSSATMALKTVPPQPAPAQGKAKAGGIMGPSSLMVQGRVTQAPPPEKSQSSKSTPSKSTDVRKPFNLTTRPEDKP